MNGGEARHGVGLRWRVRDEEHRAPGCPELEVDAAALHLGVAVEVGRGHRGAPHVREGDHRPGLGIGLVPSDLYDLAGGFSAFYTADKVNVTDPATRARRLLLCRRTLLVLETGLSLLGLRTVERM